MLVGLSATAMLEKPYGPKRKLNVKIYGVWPVKG